MEQSQPDLSRSITFRQSSGEVHPLEVTLTETVAQVKEMLRERYFTKPLTSTDMQVSFGGRELDDDATLAHYAVELGSTLDLEVIRHTRKC
jgi:hypothetical protein